jgi:hypothetical protein
MYKDFFPPLEGGLTPPTPVVAVITRNERVRPEAVIRVCHSFGATSHQSEGLCFWVVFEDEPKRAWPMTEACVRSSVDKDGYIKCDSWKPHQRSGHVVEEELLVVEEPPSYLFGVGISTG